MKEKDQSPKHLPNKRAEDREDSRWARLCRRTKQLLSETKPTLRAIGRIFSLLFAHFPKWLWSRVRRPLCRYVMPAVAFLLCVGLIFFGILCAISAAVCHKTADRIVTAEQLAEMEIEFDCILVLGCRVYSDGTPSSMLSDRLTTAIGLYKEGISQTLLMSGDSRSIWYDETGAMKETALADGVPEEAILTDPMGLSTYDSIARLLHVWSGKRVVIVTQEYHLYRALYIAEKLGIEAYGVSADQRSYAEQIKFDLREIFARCKDVYYALEQPTPAGLAS